MNNTKVAKELIALSRLLIANPTLPDLGDLPFVEKVKKEKDEEVVPKDIGLRPEIATTAKKVGELAVKFKETHKDLLAELADMEAKVKEKKAVLSAFFKDWEMRTVYMKTRKELMKQANTCLEIGDVLNGLGDDILLSARESQKPSYQQQVEILLSTLNAAELKKYENALANYFKKTIISLDTGVGHLDDDIKDWHDSAKELAEKRGIKLPTASRMPVAMNRLRVRNAGMWDTVKSVLTPMIPDFVKRIVSWAKDLYQAVLSNGDELTKLEKQVELLEKKVRISLP